MTASYDAYARFYDVDTGDYGDDIPFLVATAHRTGGPVLEVGCGTGRVLIPIAEAGRDVVGVDVSTAMIDIARKKVAAAGLVDRVRLVVGDARRLSLGEQFPLIVVAFNSFTHFETLADQAKVLGRLHDHLRPDGTLILDLPNPETTLLADGDGKLTLDYVRPFAPPGTMLMKFRSQRVDPVTQQAALTFFFDEVASNGHVQRSIIPFQVRYLTASEAGLLLERTGFAVEGVFGDYDLGPHTSSSEKLVILARRL